MTGAFMAAVKTRTLSIDRLPARNHKYHEKDLRDQWLRAPDLTSQKALAAMVQRQAFIDVPMLPLGLYYQPAAFRSDLGGMLKGLNLFTGVRRI
jgi:hypothetical protein